MFKVTVKIVAGILAVIGSTNVLAAELMPFASNADQIISFKVVGAQETIQKSLTDLKGGMFEVKGPNGETAAFVMTQYYANYNLVRFVVTDSERKTELAWIQVGTPLVNATCMIVPLRDTNATLQIGPWKLDHNGQESIGGCPSFRF